MRFMMIVKANTDSETGRLPSTEELTQMGKYNEELVKAGILLAGEGLHPSSRGVRVAFSPKGTTVTDGPFSETKELIAGFWIIEVKSREEAIAWARRIPFQDGEVEIRQVASAEDFAPSDPTGELRAKEEALRAQLEAKAKA
ncbi:YciI family protein [Corallococcus exercitus]|uniref:YciI family protein n=1 Tax=Corallococcus exercitus TaxID=2316736 RepID=UPI0035D436C7